MAGLTPYLTRKLLPGFKSGHTRYVECVKELFQDGCRWLDAGGGRRIFHDLYDGEHTLVNRAARVVVCDADLESLSDHVSVSNRVCCDLAKIPLPSNSFDLITCGMVVEHIPRPGACIKEFSRLLDSGGILVIHTVNLYAYPTLIAIASKILPFRQKLIAKVTGRKEEDIFPTLYRCNTAGTIKAFLNDAGLQTKELRYMDSGILFRSVWPIALLECMHARMTRWALFSRLRGQLLIIAVKP